MSTARSGFRPDIEGVRGIAILLVVLYHLGVPGFSGGFVGVDVFFALSGYLITGLLYQELKKTGRIDLRQFYARRTRRLLPAAALVLLTTLVVGRFVLSPLEQREFSGGAVATAAYVSNLWFADSATDYLGSAPEANPFLHTWSLSVEEQFYVVWPLLMLLAYRARRLKGVTGGVTVLSFVLCWWLTSASQPWAFFGSPARAWEFGLGALGALAPWPTHTAWVGLVMVLGSAAGFSDRTIFPGAAALVPVLGTVALIASSNARIRAMLSVRPLQYFGTLSYSWYLWHWPVLVFAKGLFPTLDLWQRLLCGVFSLAIAAATHAVLENPIRFAKPLVRRPALSLACALCLTFVDVGASSWWRQAAVAAAARPDQQRFTLARDDSPVIYSNGCHLSIEATKSPECVFGNPRSTTTVVLFGDSHAGQWFPAIERVARERNWRLASFTKSGCPFAEIVPFDFRRRRPYTECEEWRHAALRRISELSPALVILASSSGYLDDGGRMAPLTSEEWFEGLQQTMGVFNKAGLRTVVIEDTPTPGFDVPTCLARHAWSSGLTSNACAFERVDDKLAVQIERRAARDLNNVRRISLSDRICSGPMCEPISHGVMVYQDDNHLTAHFSQTLSTDLGQRIAGLEWGRRGLPARGLFSFGRQNSAVRQTYGIQAAGPWRDPSSIPSIPLRLAGMRLE